MPTQSTQVGATVNYNFPPVLATEGDLSSPRGVTIDLTKITADYWGNKVIAPGSVLLYNSTTGMGEILAGARVKTQAASGQTKLITWQPHLFKAADVIKAGSTTLGTIAAGGVNLQTGEITFTANLAAAVAAGTWITSIADLTPLTVLGITVAPIDLDSFSNDVAAYMSASVYRDRLPFWDSSIAAKLPEIKLTPRPQGITIPTTV